MKINRRDILGLTILYQSSSTDRLSFSCGYRKPRKLINGLQDRKHVFITIRLLVRQWSLAISRRYSHGRRSHDTHTD